MTVQDNLSFNGLLDITDSKISPDATAYRNPVVWQSFFVIRKLFNIDSSLMRTTVTLNSGHLNSTDTHDNSDTSIAKRPA